MNKDTQKYLWDIFNHIEELEQLTARIDNITAFEKDRVVVRASERLFEIIGEAVKKALVSDSSIQLRDSAKIIGMRNKIAHGYDEVDVTVLYAALRNSVPVLKAEIRAIIGGQ